MFIFMFLFILDGILQSALVNGDLDQGWTLVQNYCARRHVIGNFNKFSGIGSTLPFVVLRRMVDGVKWFGTFYIWRPHPIFVRISNVPKWSNVPVYVVKFTVTPEAIDDLLAFVKIIEKLVLWHIPVVNGVGSSGIIWL